MRDLGAMPREEGKGYLQFPSLNRQMALLPANKDLISTGMKEFNALLNQQVSEPMCCLKGQVWCVAGLGRAGKGE